MVHEGHCFSTGGGHGIFALPLRTSNYTMPWSNNDRVRAVELYFREGSTVAAQRAFRRELGRRRAPERRTLLRWVADFEGSGAPQRPSHHTPRPRVSRGDVRAVRRAIQRNPRLSTRRLSTRVGVPRTTVQRILRQRLGLHPYKVQLLQRLKRGDKAARSRFCKWALGKWRSRGFRQGLLMTDEAQFYLDGTVQKKNCRIWGSENPHAAEQRDQYSPCLTVWCGVCAKGIVGPFFFETRGHPVRVTAARYRDLLRDQVVPALNALEMPLSRVWWQQDGATPHTATAVLADLTETFPGKVISKGANVPWPPRSPDLTLPDFFLWGYLKARVYGRPLQSIRALKARIRRVVAAVPRSVVRAAVNAVPLRLRECLRRRGGHLEHVLPRGHSH